jgi:hypothetical protein
VSTTPTGARYMLLMDARHDTREAQHRMLALAERLRDTEGAAPLLAAAFSLGAAAERLEALSGLPPRTAPEPRA